MTADSQPAPRLWTTDGFRESDPWIVVGEDTPAGEALIHPLAGFLAEPEAILGRSRQVGVLVLPGEAVESLEPFLGKLDLIALAFPSFNDGRSFSKAEILRRRYSFEGKIRATGDVLIDQIPHMLRLGFDEFEVKNPTALKRLAEGQIGGIALHYQPTIADVGTEDRYVWRRRPLASAG